MLSAQFERQVMLGVLLEQGLLVEGHVDFGNGYHGTSYLHAHPLLDNPYSIMQHAQMLKDKIPPSIWSQVDVVIGAITGGALLACMLAIAIDTTRHERDAKRVKFAPVYKVDGKPSLRQYYRQMLEGAFQEPGMKALVIDDVCNTGLTLRACRALVEECGAQVLGTAVLFDREAAIVDLPNHFALGRVTTDPGLVRQEECPDCRLHIPITRF